MSRMQQSRRGMTLLEIMAVVAIIGLLMALSIAGFQSTIDRTRRSGAQRSILMIAQEARQQARQSQQPVRLALTTALIDGRSVPAIRWERLDSANSWEITEPKAACIAGACTLVNSPDAGGAAECSCNVGESVPIQGWMDVSSLDGVCWMPDDSHPVVAKEGGRTCDPANDPPDVGSLQLVRKNRQGVTEAVEQVLVVDGLTGAVRMADCELHPGVDGCPTN